MNKTVLMNILSENFCEIVFFTSTGTETINNKNKIQLFEDYICISEPYHTKYIDINDIKKIEFSPSPYNNESINNFLSKNKW